MDRHYWTRQDDLDIEKVVRVPEWSFCVNKTLLTVCIADPWDGYKFGTGLRSELRPHEFYLELAYELIDNRWDVNVVNTSNIPSEYAENDDEETQIENMLLNWYLTRTKEVWKINQQIQHSNVDA